MPTTDELRVEMSSVKGWIGKSFGLLPVLLLVLSISVTALLTGCCGNGTSDSDGIEGAEYVGGGKDIPHNVSGQENCLACHNLYVAWPMPDDHEGRGLGECGRCHRQASVLPMSVPHDPKYNRECTSCHAPDGFQYLSEESHGSGRGDLSCMMCHEAGTPAMAAPHSEVTFRENCLQCHDFDAIAPMPRDHEGRHHATCSACHSRPTVAPMDIAHNQDDRCADCHASDEVVALPESHEGRTVDTCKMCHEYFDGVVPQTHPLESGKHGCWGCHAPEPAMAPLSPTHDGRRQETCEVSVCHAEQYQFSDEILQKLAVHPPTKRCSSGADGGCHVWTDDPDYNPEWWITAIPADTHGGRSQETCVVCHEMPAI